LAVEAAEARIAHTVGVDVTLATPVAAVAADLGGAIPRAGPFWTTPIPGKNIN